MADATSARRRPTPTAAPGAGTTAESAKFRDPMESVSDKISGYLNQHHAATMLLIAWHHARKPETIIAQVMQIDRLGFEVRCHYHGARYSEERVNFSCGPIDNGNQFVDHVVVAMRREAMAPKWPHGPLVKIVLAVYLALAVVYYESHGGEDMTFLPGHWAEHVPDKVHLTRGFQGVMAAHTVMAAAACFVLGRHRLKAVDSARELAMWFATCFILGYPAWYQVLALKRASSQGRLKRI